MKLISCEHCAVMLDADRLAAVDIEDAEGHIDFDKAEWNGAEYVPIIKCPVCRYNVRIPT